MRRSGDGHLVVVVLHVDRDSLVLLRTLVGHLVVLLAERSGEDHALGPGHGDRLVGFVLLLLRGTEEILDALLTRRPLGGTTHEALLLLFDLLHLLPDRGDLLDEALAVHARRHGEEERGDLVRGLKRICARDARDVLHTVLRCRRLGELELVDLTGRPLAPGFALHGLPVVGNGDHATSGAETLVGAVDLAREHRSVLELFGHHRQLFTLLLLLGIELLESLGGGDGTTGRRLFGIVRHMSNSFGCPLSGLGWCSCEHVHCPENFRNIVLM